MARKATERVGRVTCTEPELDEHNRPTGKVCGHSMYVKRSESGALSTTCPECEVNRLYRVGTPAHAKLLKACGVGAAPEEKAPPAAEQEKPKRAGFSLGGLEL